MKIEHWVDVVGFEGLYQVSNFGNVRALKYTNSKSNNIKVLKPYCVGKDRNYLAVKLYKDQKGKQFKIHRLVAKAFIQNLHGKPQVNHINGNTFDNSVWNLEWVTNGENQKHAWENGLRVCTPAQHESVRIAQKKRWGN